MKLSLSALKQRIDDSRNVRKLTISAIRNTHGRRLDSLEQTKAKI